MTTSVASTRYLDEPVVAIKNLIGGLFAAGTFIVRVDNGSDNAYSFSNNTWTVYDKRGTRYLYGSSDSGRQYDTSTGTSTNTYKWYLQEFVTPTATTSSTPIPATAIKSTQARSSTRAMASPTGQRPSASPPRRALRAHQLRARL